jgi:hypothetical protein
MMASIYWNFSVRSIITASAIERLSIGMPQRCQRATPSSQGVRQPGQALLALVHNVTGHLGFSQASVTVLSIICR